MKIRYRSESFHFQRGGLPYYGGSNFHSAYYDTRRGTQVIGGVHSGGVGSILLYKGEHWGQQPITWVENQINWAS